MFIKHDSYLLNYVRTSTQKIKAFCTNNNDHSEPTRGRTGVKAWYPTPWIYEFGIKDHIKLPENSAKLSAASEHFTCRKNPL
jgi:hypothetical protein